MSIARGTDLPDLLTHLGYSVRQIGSYYTTKEMDSLRIKDRRIWRRYSEQTGRDDAGARPDGTTPNPVLHRGSHER